MKCYYNVSPYYVERYKLKTLFIDVLYFMID